MLHGVLHSDAVVEEIGGASVHLGVGFSVGVVDDSIDSCHYRLSSEIRDGSKKSCSVFLSESLVDSLVESLDFALALDGRDKDLALLIL